ncbi:MAG: Ig-like domain-containing protein, partial [Methanomassiliicoccales archaeon]|nr:Ig-like domain-containing protein [Methanomassiliicoccales archaeon]
NFTDDNEDLTDGNWTLYVNVTDDAATDYIDDAPFTVDTVPPEVDFVVPTEDEPYYTNNNTFDAVWEYEVDPLGTPIASQLVTISNGTANATISVDPADLTVNVVDVWGSALPDGNYTISLNATDEAGNWYNESADFTVDTVPPEVDFVVPPEDPWYTNDNNFTAAWEYEFDPLMTPIANQTLWIENETGFVMGIAYPDVDVFEFDIWTLLDNNTLADGTYTLYLNATDAAGNYYVEENAVIVDTVVPTLEVTYPDECTNDDNITATWLMNGTGSPIADIVLTITNETVGEQIFSGSIGAVDNVTFYDLLNYTLTDGVYTLEFNVTDEAGNYAIVEYEFEVDLIAPEVEILLPGSSSGPQPVGVGTFTVVFAMEVDEEGCGLDYFDVSVENATEVVWYHDVEIYMIGALYATNVTLPEDGNYNVTIFAVDEAGNNGSDMLWIFVDSAPPMLEITAPTDYYFSQNWMNVTWITGDPDGMMANTTVYLDGALVSNQSWEVMFYNFTDLADGLHNVTIKAHDIAWNEAVASVEFFLDTVQPVVVITAPDAGAYLNVSDVEVTWVADDASPSSGINHNEINIDGGSFIDVGLAESYTFIGVADGPHTVVVRSFDNASNMGSASRSFEVDTSIPVVTISFPSEGDMFASDVVTVWWNATDASTTIDLMQYMIDGGAWTDIATNSKEFDALDDGLHSVVIRAFDLAMNVGYAYVNFTTDITDPVVTISFPAANAILNYNTTTVWWNATDATTGIDHCTYSLDGGAAVTVSGAGPQFSHQFINLTDGTHTVLIIAYDGVGNHKSASVTFKVDTHAPTIQILFPSAGAYYHTVTINGTWNITDSVSGVKQIMVKLDNGSWVNIAYNQTHQFVGLTTGNHTIYLQAEDNATNVAEANVTFHIDLVAPSITSTSPSGVAVPLRTSIVIVFSKTMLKSSVGIAITPAPTARGDPVWSNGNKTVTYYVEFADSKTYTVAVHGTDLAGNAIAGSTSYSFSSLTWVHGTVVDVNGNILPKANVTLTSTLAGGSVYYTTSSDMGAIGVLVPAGEYAIKTTLSGYDTNSKTVTVGPGLSANDLGNVQLTKTMDWTLPIIIIVVGLIAVLAILFLARRK